MNRKSLAELTSYIDHTILVLLAFLVFAFPLLFTTLTTDAFTLPKQAFLGAVLLLVFLLWGFRMITIGTVFIRRAPFDIPILLFLLILFISSLLSIHPYESLIQFVSILLCALSYFAIVNNIKTKPSITFLLLAFFASSSVLSILSVLSYLKIYLLPLPITQFQTFTPVGIVLDQALFLLLTFALSFSIAKKLTGSVKNFKEKTNGIVMLATIPTIIGFLLSVYMLFTIQKPIILPYNIGFQTAFAVISQDTERIFQSFLLGSGFGTYYTDFTRFKSPSFNAYQDIWAFTFFRSSSFVLELLATTGILGFGSFLLLLITLYKIGRKHIFSSTFGLPLFFLSIVFFVFPVSFFDLTLFFIILGLFASELGIHHAGSSHSFFDVELYIVAFKQGVFAFSNIQNESTTHKGGDERSKTLPVLFFIAIAIVIGALSYYIGLFLYSDVIFQRSLVLASQNQGSQTYDEQNKAISLFPYRDSYYRIFSQTNLAVANFLSVQAQKQTPPNPQTQQTIYTLIQQAINSARKATSLSPKSALNWQNLSTIYRSLIGFGQNAENFSALASQQAIALDPNNPDEYIVYGGIYYQLGQWDEAQRQFEAAAKLKPNFANAYYNLGRYDQALDEYQKAVKLRPNFVDILTKIGMTLREKGELDPAVDAFSKAKEASSKYVPAYIHLGITYYTQNRRDLALQEWKAAQKIDPANRAVQVYLNLAKKP